MPFRFLIFILQRIVICFKSVVRAIKMSEASFPNNNPPTNTFISCLPTP